MKYRNKQTGVILEPRNEAVENQLRASDQFEEVIATSMPLREKPVSQMNKDELLAKAAELNITVPDGATNPEIVALIKAAAGR